ncbi:50S ribosomal protein L35ae [Candidatus Woesearchaeota archaeon]|nr:50S ribosomal protein L35ae [Candidatus Woesearchaeota archaeon]
MEGILSHFRQGRHHQNLKQMIMKVGDSAEEANKVIGKSVSWTSPTGKVIKGKITQLHGRTGSVRVLFLEKGLPGQTLGKKIKIE